MSKLEDVIKDKLNNQQFDNAAAGWAGLESMLKEHGKAAAASGSASAVKTGLSIKLWLSGFAVVLLGGSTLLWWNFDDQDNNAEITSTEIANTTVPNENLVASVNSSEVYEKPQTNNTANGSLAAIAAHEKNNKVSANETINNQVENSNVNRKINTTSSEKTKGKKTKNQTHEYLKETENSKKYTEKSRSGTLQQGLFDGSQTPYDNRLKKNKTKNNYEDLVASKESDEANTLSSKAAKNNSFYKEEQVNSKQNEKSIATEELKEQNEEVSTPNNTVNSDINFSEDNTELLAMAPKKQEKEEINEIYAANTNYAENTNSIVSDFKMEFNPLFMEQLLLDEIPYENSTSIANKKPVPHGPKKIDLPLILSIHGGGLLINSTENEIKQKAQIGFNFGAEVSYSKGSWLLGTGINYYQQTAAKDLSYLTFIDKSYWDINRIEYTIVTDRNYVQARDTIITYWNENLNAIDTDTVTTYDYVVNDIDTLNVVKMDTLGYVNQIDSAENQLSIAANRYIELPFVIGYEFPINRFSIQLTSGVGVGLLTTKNIIPVDAETITTSTHNKVLLNYLLRLGVVYHINDKLGIKAEPHFRTNLNNGFDGSTERLKHKSCGLNFGAIWRF